MRFASRFFLVSSLVAVPAAFVGACTSFPDLVDVGAADSSIDTSSMQPTMITTEADGAMVVTLLDGAPVPDSGPVVTGGDDSGMTMQGDDDSAPPPPAGDAGMTTPDSASPVDAGPDACTGNVDCDSVATASCPGCKTCTVASGCATCSPGKDQLTCTNGLNGMFKKTEPCCAKAGEAVCSTPSITGTYACAN